MLSEMTQGKIKQVMFKMLEQLNIINNIKDKMIFRPLLSKQTIDLIVEEKTDVLKCFLMSDMEIIEAKL